MPDLYLGNKILKKNIKAILFDKDGTLIDIHKYWYSMIRLRSEFIVKKCFTNHKDKNKVKIELMKIMGVDYEHERMKPEGPVGVKPRDFIISLTNQAINTMGGKSTINFVAKIFNDVDEYSELHLKEFVVLLPGVKEFLEKLKKHKVSANIVSTDLTNRAKKSMKILGLSCFFDNIFGGDSVKNAKPSSEIAELVISKTGLYPRDVAVIGDHPVDILMGENASIDLCIAVCNGISPRDVFKELHCEVVNDLFSLDIR